MARSGMMKQGFTPADRKKARRQLQRSGKLEGKTKEQRQKMIGRRATRIANRPTTSPIKQLPYDPGNQVGGMGTGVTSGPIDFTGPKGPRRKNPPKTLPVPMYKGGMAKKGYSKGGMVKSTGKINTGIRKCGE